MKTGKDPDPGGPKTYGSGTLHFLRIILFYRRIFGDFLNTLFTTASSTAPQIQLCRWMLESNPGLMRLRYCQSDALTTWLDLIQTWLDLIQTWLDLIQNLARSHLDLARSHPDLARSRPDLARSYPSNQNRHGPRNLIKCQSGPRS
jgi:hypothetical protein